jgi:lysophospholipase L1-like esterase
MRSVLCFGDSNTFGTAPMQARGEERRWPFAQRWPGVLQGALGAHWRVVEEGLPGRTLGRDDPVEGADRNALRYLPACLQSHRPLDAIVVMLGTNDLKARFQVNARDLAGGLHALLDAIEQHRRPEAPKPRVLVVSPPPVVEVGCLAEMFSGAESRGGLLGPTLAAVCAARGVDHLDAAALIAVNPLDGVHLDVAAHGALGLAVARWALDAARAASAT